MDDVPAGKVANKLPDEVGSEDETLGKDPYRPKSPGRIGRAVGRWIALPLESRFLLAAALTVGLSMLMLGYWVEKQIRAGWIKGMGETGAVYLEALLAPHLQRLAAAPDLLDEQKQAISALLLETRLQSRVAAIKIWSTRGELLFTTRADAPTEKLSPLLLRRVLEGQVAVEIDQHDEADHGSGAAALLEVYAPMYKRGSREVIAIGEFYEYSRALEAEVVRIKRATWFMIINVGLIIGFLLFIAVKRASRIITAQQALLEGNVARASGLAKRNNALRKLADRARLRATVLNETYLARVGADIHDGPIQMLSLLMLKLPERSNDQDWPTPAQRDEFEALIQSTLNDLRNLSAGLVLPELTDIALDEAVSLAISRHEQQTGTRVQRDLARPHKAVSDAVKVCAYRITQEALSNAYKHAGGVAQSVTLGVSDRHVTIAIRDGGGAAPERSALAQATPLGLRGMESRVQTLNGTLAIRRRESGGMEIAVQLPIRPSRQGESVIPPKPPAERPGETV